MPLRARWRRPEVGWRCEGSRGVQSVKDNAWAIFAPLRRSRNRKSTCAPKIACSPCRKVARTLALQLVPCSGANGEARTPRREASRPQDRSARSPASSARAGLRLRHQLGSPFGPTQARSAEVFPARPPSETKPVRQARGRATPRASIHVVSVPRLWPVRLAQSRAALRAPRTAARASRRSLRTRVSGPRAFPARMATVSPSRSRAPGQ